MSPALNRSSAIWHLKHSDAIKIRDGIIFDFYMGLSHGSDHTHFVGLLDIHASMKPV